MSIKEKTEKCRKKIDWLRPWYLFCKRFNKNSLLEELIFFVTYKCNFKCKTCFYADHMNRSIMNSVQELRLDEIRKISSSLGSFSRLLLSGGEPCLRDDLPQICEIFYRQNNIDTIHFPSNGFYPEKVYDYTSQILKICPGIKLIVSLPLDGFKETHDKIKGVPGSFEKSVTAVKKLDFLRNKYKNLNVYIITVVNKINFNEVIKLCGFVKDNLPVDGHGPSPMRGEPFDKDLSPPSYKEWNSLSKQLMEFYRYWNKKRLNNRLKTFLVTNRVRYLYNVYAMVLKENKMPVRCQAGNAIAVLEPNGDVRLCELTEVIGNTRDVDYDLKKVLFSDQANDLRKKIRNCACTHACFVEPSILMNPLALFRAYFLGR